MPADPYELLDSTFTDIADAIRSHGGGGYEEQVTTNVSALQTILSNETGYRGGTRVTNVLKVETHRCLITDDIWKDYGSYQDICLFIIDSTTQDLQNTDITMSQTDSVITITNNSDGDVRVQGFLLNSYNPQTWSNVAESAATIASGASKVYTGYQFLNYGLYNFFSNTIQVPIASDICPLDFARRISSSITERSKPSLNAIFTDVANAIRYEQGTSASIAVSDMPTLIRNL